MLKPEVREYVQESLDRTGRVINIDSLLGLDTGFLLEVDGINESLGVWNGDILIVKINIQPKDGDLVITSDKKGPVLFLYKQPQIRLVYPLSNTRFEPRPLIVGVVEHIIRKRPIVPAFRQ